MSRIMAKKLFPNYYLGLDCGTGSIGWAVTDLNYNILRFNGKAMWGIRLFETADSATDRRVVRCNRRRNQRRTQRIDWLQELFAAEIAKIDPTFFLRLNESRYHIEDKTERQPNALFNDFNYKDKDFFKRYPTIFHLRKELIDGTASYDIRHVYLAIHHILKNRGHFLFPGEDMASVKNVTPLFEQVKRLLVDAFDVEFNYADIVEIETALRQRKAASRKESLQRLLAASDDVLLKAMIDTMTGYKISLSKMFQDENLANAEITSINFSEGTFEDNTELLQTILNSDQFELLTVLKGIYDWSLLANIMEGFQYISYAKVNRFVANKEELCKLKRLIKTYAPDKYDSFFYDTDKPYLSAYVGSYKSNGKKTAVNRCSAEDFNKAVVKILEGMPDTVKEEPDYTLLLGKAKDLTLLPLLISSNNSVLPHQIHLIELKAILKQSERHHPFLAQKDAKGLSVSEKIINILSYRIPYYVGPITDFHDDKINPNKFAWMTRKKTGRIYPWNFDEKIDIEKSAEKFISRMTNKCTYLQDKDVLPKNSLLYSKFTVLNELNNLRINETPISIEQKQAIFDDLFKTHRKVTNKKLHDYLITQGWYNKNQELIITGIDSNFANSLGSYIDFKDFIETKVLTRTDVENIIRWITLFGADRKLLKKRVKATMGQKLSDQQIDTIINKFHYKDWGRLSKEFLTDIFHMEKSTGEVKSIITMMWETNNNLMELMSPSFDYAGQISNNAPIEKLDYSVVEQLSTSPSVKRQIWQTLLIVKEIQKIMGHVPKKVFFEFARGEEKKKRTVSRKNKLKELYSNIKSPDTEAKELLQFLDATTDSQLRSDKLYLYYTQIGKCMYSGDRIDITDLYNTNIYDIDHIYPQSKTKDDSLDNRVLVKKEINGHKSNVYPIEDSIRIKQHAFWKTLYDKNYISKEKFERLTRNHPLTDEELANFISRQLVETRQSTKIAANVLSRFFGDSTKIVYSKARNVSDFRNEFDLTKCRTVNDFHHAKDAFLNIVVGNVYDTKFTGNPLNFIKSKTLYNLTTKKLFMDRVEKAWEPQGENSTLQLVKHTLQKNNILFTRQQIERGGSFFDAQVVKGGSYQGLLPTKMADKKLQRALQNTQKNRKEIITEWTDKYGGYNKLSVAYFILVKHKKGKKEVVSFEPMLNLYKAFCKTEASLENYCTKELELVEPHIILKKVLINTLFKIDGFPMHLAGKAGEKVKVRPAVQLCLSKEDEAYIKRLSNYNDRRLKQKVKELQIEPQYDHISCEQNMILYQHLVQKSNEPIYIKRPAGQSKLLEMATPLFEQLSIEQQSLLLLQIVKYFSCTGDTVDLKLLGGSAQAGFTLIPKTLPNTKIALFINQSPTGLFEQEVPISL